MKITFKIHVPYLICKLRRLILNLRALTFHQILKERCTLFTESIEQVVGYNKEKIHLKTVSDF